MTLLLGDCIQQMKNIPSHSVDGIFTCLPKAAEEELSPSAVFSELRRILKSKTTTVLLPPNASIFAKYVMAAEQARYRVDDNIWSKPQGTRPLSCRYRPLKSHELLLIVQDAPMGCVYNPQMSKGVPYRSFAARNGETIGAQYGNAKSQHRDNPEGTRYPVTVNRFSQDRSRRTALKHADGQPLDLAEYYIKTYTNPGDTILDFCMGTGTTGEAALNLERNFIGIELYDRYFTIAKQRLGIE